MAKEGTLDPKFNDEDTGEMSLRPLYLDDFIGQTTLKSNLKVFIQSAKIRSDTLDHILFYGPPGLGKTTLSQIISHEMGTGFKSTSGPMITKTGDLAAILTNLQEGDVLFIDEIHRLNTSVEEVLYSAMEDYKLDIIIGEGPAARTIRIDLPKFTLIGATTRLGLISKPLRDRFGIPLKLNFYSIEELTQIITRDAYILKTEISKAGAEEIAKRSRGTPRIAIRLLSRIRDFACIENASKICEDIANSSLLRLEIDSRGLDESDRNYLHFIARCYGGGPVGIETIVAGMSEERDTIEDAIEPYLIGQGFLDKTPRGRVLTRLALEHIEIEI